MVHIYIYIYSIIIAIGFVVSKNGGLKEVPLQTKTMQQFDDLKSNFSQLRNDTSLSHTLSYHCPVEGSEKNLFDLQKILLN